MSFRFSQALLCAWLGIVGLGSAQAAFEVPPLTSPVEDLANMINAKDEKALRDLIRDFQSQTQSQFQVLTVKSLDGTPIEQASIQVTDQWKLGNTQRDDGVLFLIASDERKIRIEVGQGLEGVLPDIKTKRIIEDVMVPVFRQTSPSQGILIGVYQAMRTAHPEFNAIQADRGEYQEPQKEAKNFNGGLIFIIFIVIMILGRFINPGGPRRGGFGGGFYGGGGFGGGSGGGWSGGGGGFSGGGSSGNW